MKRVILVVFLGLSFLPHEFISGMDTTKINAKDYHGNTALHKATKEGKISEVQSLLRQGANPNLQNQCGYSAFCIAVQQGNLDLIKTFLDEGAKVNPDGLRTVTTPLIEAIREFCSNLSDKNRLDIVELLLNQGADPNMRPDDYGATAIDIVIQNKNLDLLKLLFNHGAKADTWSGLGEYPLHSAVRAKDLSIITFLLNNKADPNVSNATQNTPLHLAAWIGNIEILRLLLDKGGDPNALNYEQDSPLHNARNAEVAKILLKNNAEIDAKNKDGDTPLHVAARNGHSDVIQALVDNGADINLTNNKGETPLVVMIYRMANDRSSDINILDTLYTKGTKLSFSSVGTAIYECAARSNNTLLEFILSKTSNLGPKGASSLCIAILNNNLKAAEILIEYGADLNAKSQSFDGNTSLHCAVSKYHIEAMKFLLKYGAQINTANEYKDTPIHEALKYVPEQAANMIKIMLKSQEVDINSKAEVTNYMQTNFDDPHVITNVISLLFPKKPEKKVSFQLS